MRTGNRYCSLLAIAACALAGAPAVDAQPSLAQKVRTEPTTLDGLRQTRDALIGVTDFAAALDLAEQIVAAAEAHHDPNLPDDLLQLAHVQAGLEDYDAAEMTYLRAIDMREDEKGIFDPALIPAYHALGRSYIDARRFEEALTALGHARFLSQRNYGLFNLEQLPLIDDMTRARLESGDTAAAGKLQVERLETAIRHFGADAPELVAFYERLGDFYYRRLGDRYGELPAHFRAHDQYVKALEISSARFGDSSPESLELLRRMTAVEMLFRHRPPARDRLAAALDAAKDIDPKERGLSLAVLGDWAVVRDDQASARRYYGEAYAALREAADVDADRAFATPVVLDFIPPPPDGIEGEGRFFRWSWGTIELEVDVSADGRATDVRTVSMEPRIEDLEREYLERIREAHFRPRLEQGRPVARTDASYTYRFRYYATE
ncbi:MAG TPA: tetratricopeptide repeat protein [Gammaproteobacteria bacterium]